MFDLLYARWSLSCDWCLLPRKSPHVFNLFLILNNRRVAVLTLNIIIWHWDVFLVTVIKINDISWLLNDMLLWFPLYNTCWTFFSDESWHLGPILLIIIAKYKNAHQESCSSICNSGNAARRTRSARKERNSSHLLPHCNCHHSLYLRCCLLNLWWSGQQIHHLRQLSEKLFHWFSEEQLQSPQAHRRLLTAFIMCAKITIRWIVSQIGKPLLFSHRISSRKRFSSFSDRGNATHIPIDKKYGWISRKEWMIWIS